MDELERRLIEALIVGFNDNGEVRGGDSSDEWEGKWQNITVKLWKYKYLETKWNLEFSSLNFRKKNWLLPYEYIVTNVFSI